MNLRFIRCAHCGLPHAAEVVVCPGTGLRITAAAVVTAVKTMLPAAPKLDPEQEEMAGLVLDDKYQLLSQIGEGGMSTIYEAIQLGLDRRVAIKVLHPNLANEPEAVVRLQREAKVVSSIGHPNICAVFDLGQAPTGSPYLVMELLRGESLADCIKRRGSLPFEELLPLLVEVSDALDTAHANGILHRDLKPENVFVENPKRGRGARAKLLDFGVSKVMQRDYSDELRLTHTGMVMGTPYYMAPEQARGDGNLDQRVDLWAMGIIMYEALAGRRPFVASNYNALLVKILTSEPVSLRRLVPDLPREVEAIVSRSLEKPRAKRFQSARELLRALRDVQLPSGSEGPTAMFRRGDSGPQRPFDDPPAVDGPATYNDADWAEATAVDRPLPKIINSAVEPKQATPSSFPNDTEVMDDEMLAAGFGRLHAPEPAPVSEQPQAEEKQKSALPQSTASPATPPAPLSGGSAKHDHSDAIKNPAPRTAVSPPPLPGRRRNK